ncbi:MAG TPA: ABC transporter permease [Candidatus Limnocylindrales bacterium]|nr:ABC transporter permease [Candidatus Limnocylindrales bacterium]
MALLTRELRASYAFVERNFNLTKRYWGWEIAWLVYSVAGALAVSLIGVSEGNPRLLMVLVIGTIFWSYLSIVFEFIAEAVQWERWEGTLEYTFMAPVRRYAQLLGAAAYAVLFGLVHTLFVLLVLVLFFELDLANANFITAAAFTLLGTVSFAGIGIAASILPLMYVERGAQMVFVIQSVLLLVSGVYYSVDVLPGWMQVVSHFSPATYVLDGVRAGLIDGVGMGELLGNVWPLLLSGVILIPAGLWAFGVAERYAKRTGKLKRVG